MSRSTAKTHKYDKDNTVFYVDTMRLEVMRCSVDEVYETYLHNSKKPCRVEYDLQSIIYDLGFPAEKRYDKVLEAQIFATDVEAAKSLLSFVQHLMDEHQDAWNGLNAKETELQNFIIKERNKKK